ncbi:MAG: dihydrofolate reductase [Bacteroidia bacterium]
MIVSLVAAAAENNVIGKNNALPWRMPADMKFFKNLTMGHTVIMGRKTYESMGKPLPGRKNIIITRNKKFTAKDCIVLSSFSEISEHCKAESEIFVIGGAEIYQQFIHNADKIYLTRIHHNFTGDSYFPDIQADEWEQTGFSYFPKDEKNPYPYSFIEFSRRKK